MRVIINPSNRAIDAGGSTKANFLSC